jgi:hypothetical protein
VRVGLVFATGWRLGAETLTAHELALVESTALQALREAYRAFDVQFTDETATPRFIRIEDTPFRGPGTIAIPGTVGATFPVSTVSSVHVDSLYRAELAAVQCHSIVACAAKTRAQLLEGLGHGIGATAAHELGHQAGLHFSRDLQCDECYDSGHGNTYVHFFGQKHWSNEALAIMRRVLPGKS